TLPTSLSNTRNGRLPLSTPARRTWRQIYLPQMAVSASVSLSTLFAHHCSSGSASLSFPPRPTSAAILHLLTSAKLTNLLLTASITWLLMVKTIHGVAWHPL